MFLLSIRHGCTLGLREDLLSTEGPVLLGRLHGELLGGGGEEAMTVLDSLVCRSAMAPPWSHHLAWGWYQWEESWSLTAIHKWYLRRGAEPLACSQGGQFLIFV